MELLFKQNHSKLFEKKTEMSTAEKMSGVIVTVKEHLLFPQCRHGGSTAWLSFSLLYRQSKPINPFLLFHR